MKKIICLLSLIQSGFMIAQTETFVTINGKKVEVNPNSLNTAGNGLTAISGKVELGGSLTRPTTITTTETNTFSIKGLPNSSNTIDAPMVITADGTLKKGAFPTINIIPNDVGTVIAIDGKLEVAQEITAMMTANFSFAGENAVAIGNITHILIDNQNTFSGTATSNLFKVNSTGVYSININVPVLAATSLPVVGIWSDTDNRWVARINSKVTDRGNITLITSISMEKDKTYSFRIANTASTVVEAFNTGTTGTGPVAFFSLKRLK